MKFYKLFHKSGRTLCAYGKVDFLDREWKAGINGALEECWRGYHILSKEQIADWAQKDLVLWEVLPDRRGGKENLLEVSDKYITRTYKLVRKIGVLRTGGVAEVERLFRKGK